MPNSASATYLSRRDVLVPTNKYVSGASLLASGVVYATTPILPSPLRLVGGHGSINDSGIGGTYYLMVFDSATVPVDTTVADYLVGPIVAPAFFSFDAQFRPMLNGISWALSSTMPTKTLAGAYAFLSITYNSITGAP